MTGPIVSLSGVPTGGAALLSFPEYLPSPPSGVTFLSITRAVSGGTFSTVYSGVPIPLWLDVGDGTPSALASGSAYLWNATDDRGTTAVGPLTPVSTVTYASDGMTNLFVRLLQGAVDCASPPTGVNRMQVTAQMPRNGWQALPFVVVNLDLIQQTEAMIGEDVVNPNPDFDWSSYVFAKRVWRVSVFSANVRERDFWRDALLSAFRTLKSSVFYLIGLDVSHAFQASSYTDAAEWEGKTPGFYGADLMLELTGTFNTVVTAQFDTIAEIDVYVNVQPSGIVDQDDTIQS